MMKITAALVQNHHPLLPRTTTAEMIIKMIAMIINIVMKIVIMMMRKKRAIVVAAVAHLKTKAPRIRVLLKVSHHKRSSCKMLLKKIKNQVCLLILMHL
jgi:spore coat protein CotF